MADIKRVVTGKVRLSYVHLFKPYSAVEGGEEKYSVTVLIPKEDAETKKRIDNAIEAAAKEATQKIWNGVRPPKIAIPIYDGDGVRPSDGMEFGEECKGHWVITASSKADQAPEVVDKFRNPIVDQSEVYSGMYGRVAIRFFAYMFGGKKGIGAGLGNVQKLADGEPLGGSRIKAADDFADDWVDVDPITGEPI